MEDRAAHWVEGRVEDRLHYHRVEDRVEDRAEDRADLHPVLLAGSPRSR